MRMNRFFCPGPYSTEPFELPESVFRHAIQVLRLKPGNQIQLFDGQGQVRLAELLTVGRRQATARIVQTLTQQTESPLNLTLIQGISRGERMDYAIQKAVELGVNRIIPVQTARCNVNLKADRADKRWAHWQGVLISACEQSGRNVLPQLQDVVTLEQALSSSRDDCRLVLAPDAQIRFSELLPAEHVTLLIGPEGGLSEDELEQAFSAGFTGLRFGPRVLRTETAAVAALAVIQARWGDIG